MRKFLLVTALLFLSAYIYSQEGKAYEIGVTISDISDSTIFLAYHFGDRQYITDTVKLDGNGHGVFAGKEKLPEGIYMIVLPGRKYFEFLMTENQYFSLGIYFFQFQQCQPAK